MSEIISTAVLLEFFNNNLLLPVLPSFNRLEGRPRTHNFDQALRAEIRDPLWMLTKQWQLGEFKGDDAGSPVSAKVCMKQTQITKYQSAKGPLEAFDNTLPLEAKVEQRKIPFTAGEIEIALDLRIVLGRHWKKLLLKNGYSQTLVDTYIEKFPTYDSNPNNRDDAYYCGDKISWQKHKAVSQRHIDGKKLYDSIKADDTQHPLLVGADAADHAPLQTLGLRFVKWYEKLFLQPHEEVNDAWLPEQLEYQFSCSAPKPEGEQIYTAKEYYQGHLDWYNFSINDENESLGEVTDEVIPDHLNKKIVRNFIPVPVSFDGMPNTRWWSFEEGKTNFGDINPDTTDLNKLLLIEFGLIYANDWYTLPVTLPAGNILNIKGLSIKNVFGENLWISATGNGLDDADDRWSMYSLDIEGNAERDADLSLVVVPSVPKIHEGKALEEVLLTRDETANMVWGIETTVPLPSGESVPGLEAARDTLKYHKRIIGGAPSAEVPAKANLRYQIMSSVPENWIPFISTHVDGNNRSTQLQRGSMPRTIEGDPEVAEKIKPRTNLLRTGLNQPTKESYFIHEEEVPRSGVMVKQSFQRTRWYNGQVYTWVGVRKQTGRGESSSQLKFDYLKPVKFSE